MKEVSKAIAVISNLANYAVGIAVAVILIFRLDFVSVFYISGMTSNECLFFNMTAFQLGLMLLCALVCMMVNDEKKPEKEIEFPVFYAAIPIVISGISIFYGIAGETTREKIFVIISAILYTVLSAISIYCGTRIFQTYKK